MLFLLSCSELWGLGRAIDLVCRESDRELGLVNVLNKSLLASYAVMICSRMIADKTRARRIYNLKGVSVW